jgi:hypothetical protein
MTDEAIKTTLETMLEFEAIENRIKNNNFEIGELLLSNDQNIIFTTLREDYFWDVTNKKKYRKISYNLKVSHVIIPSNSIKITTQIIKRPEILGIKFYHNYVEADGGICVVYKLLYNNNDFDIKSLIDKLLNSYFNEIKSKIQLSVLDYKFSNLNDIVLTDDFIIQILQDLKKLSIATPSEIRHDSANSYQLIGEEDKCQLIVDKINEIIEYW